jgi:hypothetical protein
VSDAFGRSGALAALVDELAADAGDVTPTDTPAGREYARGGTTFAVLAGAAVELRLEPDIAEAARRTPDTGTSARGEDWVRFAPPGWDKHAEDRLEAWFRVAWRSAGRR